MNEPSRHEIIASDGQSIVGHFFAPDREATGVVLIVPAMGTTQRYYAAFARWLAAQGFLVVTFDSQLRTVSLARTPAA